MDPFRMAPSNATDPYWSSVKLLLHGIGTNGSTTFTDSSNSPTTVTPAGNAQISTAQYKFGGSSMLFDGSGDRLVATDAKLALGTGNFTFEMFVRASTSASGIDYFFGSEYSDAFWFVLSYEAGTTAFKLQGTPSIGNGNNTGYSTGVWYHIAYVRNSGTGYFFIDGIQKGSTFSITSNITINSYLVGGSSTSIAGSASWFQGNIAEVRITAAARYTANFTPPTAAFPDS
jgi:hypothetical protein